MRIKHLLWASILPMAFAACQQNEEALAPESNNGNSVEVKGAVKVENPVFYVNKDEAETRMVAPNGVVQWADGDQVGLVWLNAYEIGKNYVDDTKTWSDWMPSQPLIGSNTRITYTGEGSKFDMKDGQLFEGQYICYYPYNDAIKSVTKFYLTQDGEQAQATSAVDGKNEAPFAYIANHLNWLSRVQCTSEQDGDPTSQWSYLYHIDSQRSGLVTNIHIPMKRYSNVAEFRLNGIEPRCSSVKWEDLTIDSYELIALEDGEKADVFPTKATFDFTNGNVNDKMHLLDVTEDGDYVENGSSETIGNGGVLTDWKRNEENWKTPYYTGIQKVAGQELAALDGTEEYVVNSGEVSNLTLKVENPAVVGSDANIQRAMFLTLPIVPEKLEGLTFKLRIHTDYGYVDVEEKDWKKYIGQDPDPVVNGTNWISKNEFADYNTLVNSKQAVANLLSLIGQKVTRYVAVDPDELVYNNVVVNNTDELVAAIAKWNALGKADAFTVLACDQNKFDNLDWAADSETSEEIVKFLSNPSNELIFGTEHANKTINFGGNTNFNAEGTLTFSAPVVIADGTLTVEKTQELASMTTMPGSNLVIKSGAYLNNTKTPGANYTLNGNTTIEQNARLHNSHLINNGVLTTNGNVMAESFTNNADAEYHVGTFSTVNVNAFNNEGEVYYDQQGDLFKNVDGNAVVYIDNKNNVGRVIATVNEGDDANTLSDYILAANRFRCTDLVLNNNSYFTSNQWDTSLSTVSRFGFIRVKMNDGVKLNFLKGVNFGSAEVEIAEGASVEWAKHSENQQAIAPTFTIKKLVVKGGATLNVSGISVVNSLITDMVMGGEGVTTTLIGTSCFANGKTQTITIDHGSEGTLIVK